MSEPASTSGPIGCDVEHVVRAERRHDAFEYHACSPADRIGRRRVPPRCARRPGRDHRAVRRLRLAMWLTFGHREETPLQCLILPIGLAQSQGGSRLHHLIAQVEGVGRRRTTPIWSNSRNGSVSRSKMLIIEGMDQAPLGEDPPVRVADPPLELGEVLVAEFGDLGIAQHHQAGLDVLGQRPARDGVMGQPPGEVDLADRGARPVDHGGRQHAADAQLLAEADQDRVDPGRVNVGQLGQVAHAHHDLGIGVSAGGSRGNGPARRRSRIRSAR